MSFKTDIEIAQETKLQTVFQVGEKLGLSQEQIEPYGHYKGKIEPSALAERKNKADGKLVLVTAMTPTPAGEGKTTMTVGLGDGLNALGKKVVIALREPSLGPVFGMKGGAAGGGYSQVAPMEDINLHFTGDFHAIGAANNLLAAMIDNHIHHGNALDLDVNRITWKRAVDMNDRELRHIVGGLGTKGDGVPREDGFDITVASEIMAILCLAEDMADLKDRLGRIIVGYNRSKEPVLASQLKAQGAMAVLLKDAMKPNLVQSLEGTPALIHGGPFANIAHGCNSLIATKTALKLGDYVVTEAGFGGDLGAEKFLDIKCRAGNLVPSAVVVVGTVRAVKHHGGVAKADLGMENLTALEKGFPNLLRHVKNMTDVYHLPAVVVINQFPTDTPAETAKLKELCESNGIPVAVSTAWADGGGKGSHDLAEIIVDLCEKDTEKDFTYSYHEDASIVEKLTQITQKIYGGAGVTLTAAAERQAKEFEELGFGKLPICVAKTQYSFSDDATKLCAPEDFTVTVRELKVSAGAGFIVALTGSIMTMPGLPKVPSAEKIDIDANGVITGLF